MYALIFLAGIFTLNINAKADEEYVAKIEDTMYVTLDEAVVAAQDGETIELLKDVRTIHQNIITDTKNGILDLNGKKITKYSLSPIFENNGIFKIKDSTTVVGENNVVIDGAGSLNNIFGKILENISLEEYTIIVTADHGNCEVMRNKDNSINTSHTTNVVPFIITDKSLKLIDGKLGDIAPTILTLMGLEVPSEMTGNILIKSRKKR